MPREPQHTISDAEHVTWEQLKIAASKRLGGAQRLLESAPVPQVVVYLLHVALECALKSRIIRRARCRSVRDLRDRNLMPEVDYLRIFRGTAGHRLADLADVARLNQLLVDTETTLEPVVWRRMCHDMRPYSARYGSENPSVRIAQAEFAVGKMLVNLLAENTR